MVRRPAFCEFCEYCGPFRPGGERHVASQTTIAIFAVFAEILQRSEFCEYCEYCEPLRQAEKEARDAVEVTSERGWLRPAPGAAVLPNVRLAKPLSEPGSEALDQKHVGEVWLA
jgi:hypothetical protein